MGNLKIIKRYNPYFMISKEVIDDVNLGEPELIVYIFICRFSDENVKPTGDAIKTLAFKTGYTYGITKQLVESLTGKGLISVNQTANEYQITILK